MYLHANIRHIERKAKVNMTKPNIRKAVAAVTEVAIVTIQAAD